MAYRQTNTLRPTEEQFKELFDLQINTFWKHKAYTYYDPQLVFSSKEEMRDMICEWSLNISTFFQMWWEDDTLLGFRSFLPCQTSEDVVGGTVQTATPDGPISKIIGEGYERTTLRTDIFIGRPDSTGSQENWMFKRPEVAPVWNNNDGESVYQAIIDNGFERAYSCAHGMVQKQHLWNNRDTDAIKHDIFLKYGYSFSESRELGFDPDEQKSFIYRLVGGESIGWPPIHSSYHHQNTTRPDKVERPFMVTRDDPNKPQEAPIPKEG